MLQKLISYAKGFLRASPCMIIAGSMVCYILFQKKFGLYFSVYILLVDLIGHFLKKITKNYLYNGKINLPIIGRGPRPEGAKFTGCFIDDDNLEGISKSYGMPSGHSIMAVATSVILSWFIVNSYEKSVHRTISLIALNVASCLILYSRLSLNCHTVGQVIVGSIIGFIFGIIGIKLFKKLNILERL